MLPVVTTIGDRVVYTFAVVTALAIATAGSVAMAGLRRQGLGWGLAGVLVVAVASAGLFGARGWWLAAAHGPDPRGWGDWGGGLVWWGGVFGGALAAVVVLRACRISVWSGLDALAPAAALGLAIGRIGCHLAGDGDWGTSTQLPWGVSYVEGVAGWPYPLDVHVHPVALYESGASFGIFLWTVRMARAGVSPGQVVAWWALLAGALRALLECVRTNPPLVLGLTAAQVVGIGLAATGAWALVAARRGGDVRTPAACEGRGDGADADRDEARDPAASAGALRWR